MKSKKIVALVAAVSLLAGCESDNSSLVCGPKTETINLSADALFEFDKFSQNDLLPKGKKSLDNLAGQLMNVYTKVNMIGVVGHTDRIGSEQYNYQLGLNRANTIKQYLVARGVKAKISIKSVGEKSPVTNGCRGLAPQSALAACLQPDRRVVISINGFKKVQ